MADRSTNPAILELIIGVNTTRAVVHSESASFDVFVHVPSTWHPKTSIDLWSDIIRPRIEKEGLRGTGESAKQVDPHPDTLDDFAVANSATIPLAVGRYHVLDTEEFSSVQQACQSIADCAGWWRFSRIGYSGCGSEALVHVDHEHPKWGLMGTGEFVLLNRIEDEWKVTGTRITWVS